MTLCKLFTTARDSKSNKLFSKNILYIYYLKQYSNSDLLVSDGINDIFIECYYCSSNKYFPLKYTVVSKDEICFSKMLYNLRFGEVPVCSVLQQS